jgi:hypothetical protein
MAVPKTFPTRELKYEGLVCVDNLDSNLVELSRNKPRAQDFDAFFPLTGNFWSKKIEMKFPISSSP